MGVRLLKGRNNRCNKKLRVEDRRPPPATVRTALYQFLRSQSRPSIQGWVILVENLRGNDDFFLMHPHSIL